MSINEKCDEKFKDVQPVYSRNSESWIRNLVWVYTVIAVVALAQFVFLAVKYSGQFSEFCDYIFNPDPNKPLSLILLASGGWFIVLLSLAAVILVIAIFIAYWIIGIVSGILLRKKLQKGTCYRRTGIFFGIWACIPTVLLIYSLMDWLKNIFTNSGTGAGAIPSIWYVIMMVSAAIGMTVLVIIYRNGKIQNLRSRKAVGDDAGTISEISQKGFVHAENNIVLPDSGGHRNYPDDGAKST